MQWIPVLVLLWLISGCGVRGQVRSATLGVFDALDHPDPKDRLAVKTRLLAERYVDAALKASDGKGVGTISGEIVEGVMQALSARMPEERELVEALVSEAVQATFAEVERSLSSRQNTLRRVTAELARSARQTTGAAVDGATEQLFGQVERGLGSDGHGPLAEALTASMQRTTAAAVQGAAEQLASSINLCPASGGDPTVCQEDLVRRISRSAAVGIAEGVGRPLEVWPLAGMFVAGVVAAAIGAWVFRVLGRRRGTESRAT
jgi:hypothetical protein